MSIHKYIFWIENKKVQIYKDGNIERYKGEDFVDFSKGIENFWNNWEENSCFLKDDFVDFIFIGKDKNEINNFIDYSSKYKKYINKNFKFKDLKKILENKKLNKFVISTKYRDYFFKKGEDRYFKVPKEKKLETIFIIGENVAEDICAEEKIDFKRECKTDEKESKMTAFFKNKLKEYERRN